MPPGKKVVQTEETEELEDMPEEEPVNQAALVQTLIPGVERPESLKRKKRTPLTEDGWIAVADCMKVVRFQLNGIYEAVEGATSTTEASLIASAIRTLATASRRVEVAAYRQIGKAAVGMFEMESDQEA